MLSGTTVICRTLLLSALPLSALPGMGITVRTSQPSPLPVAEVVTFNTQVTDAVPGPIRYRLRTRRVGELAWRMVADYGVDNQFDWTASDHEGSYEIEISVRNLATGDTAVTVTPFEFTALAIDTPQITRTRNPLVFLYSAPACQSGATLSVAVTAAGANSPLYSTPPEMCVAGQTSNVYLAGVKQYASYTVQHMIQSGNGNTISAGPKMTLSVGAVSPWLVLPTSRVLTGSTDRPRNVLLQSSLFVPTSATDLAGNLMWYYDAPLSFLTRPNAGGTFWGIYQPVAKAPEYQIVRLFDLAGVTRAQTTAERVNQQLKNLGVHPITAFHHEALGLPDGRMLVLASTERLVSSTDGTGKRNVLGDTILLLDANLQVLWTWDAFDHLDVSRKATLGETCTPYGAGCPPFSESAEAEDWLHGNSLQLLSDGAILYSSRHQDQLFKIDFANGSGSGKVLWKIGRDGDFRLAGASPDNWFSHQHDARLLDDGTTLYLYDNNNVQQSSNPGAHSRGQVYKIDQVNRVARLVVNADLGVFSSAVGSAQPLPDGSQHFSSGFVPGPSGMITRVAETDRTGRITFELEISTADYRVFRMLNLYAMQ